MHFLESDMVTGQRQRLIQISYISEKFPLSDPMRFRQLYFPRCIDLLEAGMVDVKSLISHRFKLEDLPTAMAQYLAEKDKAVKAIMVNE